MKSYQLRLELGKCWIYPPFGTKLPCKPISKFWNFFLANSCWNQDIFLLSDLFTLVPRPFFFWQFYKYICNCNMYLTVVTSKILIVKNQFRHFELYLTFFFFCSVRTICRVSSCVLHYWSVFFFFFFQIKFFFFLFSNSFWKLQLALIT